MCVDVALRGGRAWWVSPTYRMAQVGWRQLAGMGQQLGHLAEVRRGDQEIVLRGGGSVVVRSADDPSRLRGEGLDLVVVDEAAHMRNLRDIWEQALRPALADRQGRALFISTPAGINYFHELYQAGIESDTRDWCSFHFASWENPHLDPAEVEAMRAQMPALVFRQEIEAEFVQLEGAMFRREMFRIVDATDAPATDAEVRFWDLAASAKTTADYTVGARVGRTSDNYLVIRDVVRGRWEWPEAARIIAETARADGPAVAQGIEAVGTQRGMAQILRRDPSLLAIAVSPVEVAGDKVQRALAWLGRAEAGNVYLVHGGWNAVFLDEACAFPESEHDDQVDAVSGAVQMLADAVSAWSGWWDGTPGGRYEPARVGLKAKIRRGDGKEQE
jgi:predicted phage terminase large subunit-like protein